MTYSDLFENRIFSKYFINYQLKSPLQLNNLLIGRAGPEHVFFSGKALKLVTSIYFFLFSRSACEIHNSIKILYVCVIATSYLFNGMWGWSWRGKVAQTTSRILLKLISICLIVVYGKESGWCNWLTWPVRSLPQIQRLYIIESAREYAYSWTKKQGIFLILSLRAWVRPFGIQNGKTVGVWIRSGKHDNAARLSLLKLQEPHQALSWSLN